MRFRSEKKTLEYAEATRPASLTAVLRPFNSRASCAAFRYPDIFRTCSALGSARSASFCVISSRRTRVNMRSPASICTAYRKILESQKWEGRSQPVPICPFSPIKSEKGNPYLCTLKSIERRSRRQKKHILTPRFARHRTWAPGQPLCSRMELCW